jgi:peptide/nickel transport system substrate-binding protein
MLEIFYNDPPWLLMYFAPVLEAVSNRLEYTPRIDTFFTIYNVQIKQ